MPLNIFSGVLSCKGRTNQKKKIKEKEKEKVFSYAHEQEVPTASGLSIISVSAVSCENSCFNMNGSRMYRACHAHPHEALAFDAHASPLEPLLCLRIPAETVRTGARRQFVAEDHFRARPRRHGIPRVEPAGVRGDSAFLSAAGARASDGSRIQYSTFSQSDGRCPLSQPKRPSPAVHRVRQSQQAGKARPASAPATTRTETPATHRTSRPR